jgi:hypothetical protein
MSRGDPTVSRHHCLTKKVATEFGTLYAQIDVDENGKISGISVSSHSKHEDTAVERALSALAQAFRDMIDEIRVIWS